MTRRGTNREGGERGRERRGESVAFFTDIPLFVDVSGHNPHLALPGLEE